MVAGRRPVEDSYRTDMWPMFGCVTQAQARTYIVLRFVTAARTVPLGTVQARTRREAKLCAAARWPRLAAVSLRVVAVSSVSVGTLGEALARDGRRALRRRGV